jgi:hypothetical protein
MSRRSLRTTALSVLLLSASVAAPVSSASAAAAPQTYPLVCKGTNLGVSASSGGGVAITFTRYPSGAGVLWDALTPGSCAWVDRPVSSNEPNRLCYIGAGPFDISWVTRSQPHVEQVYNDGNGCLRLP